MNLRVGLWKIFWKLEEAMSNVCRRRRQCRKSVDGGGNLVLELASLWACVQLVECPYSIQLHTTVLDVFNQFIITISAFHRLDFNFFCMHVVPSPLRGCVRTSLSLQQLTESMSSLTDAVDESVHSHSLLFHATTVTSSPLLNNFSISFLLSFEF